MKKLIGVTVLALVGLFALGCDDDNQVFNPVPTAPQGVYSVTGDGEVTVYWNGIYESDVESYLVYRSFDPVTNYQQIAEVAADNNPNLDLLLYHYVDTDVENGTTYYYAVASVDRSGQVSDLSAENVYDTPRPQGTVTLFPNNTQPALSGFNLAGAAVVPDTSSQADVFVDVFDGVHYLNAANVNTDIQDMGYTSDFDEISYSPDMGWSDLGFVELILGHTYIIWTADDHYAKMRATSLNANGSVTFEWAYQTDAGNLELAPPNLQRPEHGPDYLMPKKDMILIR